jgi:hypothetical protein
MKRDRIVRQVNKMVATGRITEEEAERLRVTEGTADFDAAVGRFELVTRVRIWTRRSPPAR